MIETLKIFVRQVTLDAHKLYYVSQLKQSKQRLTSGTYVTFVS